MAFIPYLTAGDPDLDTTAQALRLLDDCGADIIELGVPYSDPLADGPVIQACVDFIHCSQYPTIARITVAFMLFNMVSSCR